MGPKIFVVDAFISSGRFTGNPAAVCILERLQPDEWMQSIAAEMKHSETAFLFKLDNGYSLRWFTPTVEVELCGHATLASAHILWEEGYLDRSQDALFYTLSGKLTARSLDEWIDLDFPQTPEAPAVPPIELLGALDVRPAYVGKNKFDYLIEVENEEDVRSITPDFNRLREVPVRGVAVTSTSRSTDYDFVSRFFAPGSGVDEDPVTGSAHCCLGPYWGTKLGKNELVAYQASSRGGIVRIRILHERVRLRGKAVTVVSGHIS